MIFSHSLPLNLKCLAGVLAGTAIIGYTAYFDYKRRSAHNYKETIRQKRKAKQREEEVKIHKVLNNFPDLSDSGAVQAFLFEQLAIGEQLLGEGNIQMGANHMANAVVLSGRQQDLLGYFHEMLPEDQFNAIVTAIPTAAKRFENSRRSSGLFMGGGGGPSMMMASGGSFGAMPFGNLNTETTSSERIRILDEEELE